MYRINQSDRRAASICHGCKFVNLSECDGWGGAGGVERRSRDPKKDPGGKRAAIVQRYTVVVFVSMYAVF